MKTSWETREENGIALLTEEALYSSLNDVILREEIVVVRGQIIVSP